MPAAVAFIVVGVELMVIGACAVGWIRAVKRRSQGQPIYPYQPRLPVPWGLLDLGMVALTALTAMVIGVAIISGLLGIDLGASLAKIEPRGRAILMLTDSTISFTVLVASLLWLRWRVHAGLHDLGVDPDRIDSDIGLGMAAFAMLAVPVFLIQLSLLKLFPDQDEHPLIEMLREDSSPTLLLVSLFVAVLVAPIVEEFVFRVLLQGWLENVACRIGDFQAFLFGPAVPDEKTFLPKKDGTAASDVRVADAEFADDAVGGGEHIESSPGVREDEPDPVDRQIANPYQSRESRPDAPRDVPAVKPGKMRPRYWPIFVSSAIFAAVHLGHGYAPIPLFFLSLGLGYLYQQTHRVVPCIVVHLLLNASSMAALWLSLIYGENP
jgi:membrane protease YdiL (CAAX protease family)